MAASCKLMRRLGGQIRRCRFGMFRMIAYQHQHGIQSNAKLFNNDSHWDSRGFVGRAHEWEDIDNDNDNRAHPLNYNASFINNQEGYDEPDYWEDIGHVEDEGKDENKVNNNEDMEVMDDNLRENLDNRENQLNRNNNSFWQNNMRYDEEICCYDHYAKIELLKDEEIEDYDEFVHYVDHT